MYHIFLKCPVKFNIFSEFFHIVEYQDKKNKPSVAKMTENSFFTGNSGGKEFLPIGQKTETILKRNKTTKQELPRRPVGCLPLMILAIAVVAMLAFGHPVFRKNIDYFMRGEADVGQFAAEVKTSYQKHLTYPDFIFPLPGTITSPFGERLSPISGQQEVHTGIDIDINAGTEVKAAADGTVFKVGNDERFGNYILISHNEVFTTCYAHLESAGKQEGEVVKQGDIIGVAGATGNVTGPHLHFEIRKGEKRMNPLPFLPEA